MALLGGGNVNCRIEENVHLATLSKWTQSAPRACAQGDIDLDHGRPVFDPLEKHVLAHHLSFAFAQRAAAAWRAISLRRLLLSFWARARPPAKPP